MALKFEARVTLGTGTSVTSRYHTWCRCPHRDTLRFSKLGIDEAHLSGCESAAGELIEMRQTGIDLEPGTEFVPGCFRTEAREIDLSELCPAESFDSFFHYITFLIIILQRYKKN